MRQNLKIYVKKEWKEGLGPCPADPAGQDQAQDGQDEAQDHQDAAQDGQDEAQDGQDEAGVTGAGARKSRYTARDHQGQGL